MAYRARRVDYFYTTLKDQPGEAYRLLAQLASSDVNLLAFGAIPVGPARGAAGEGLARIEGLVGILVGQIEKEGPLSVSLNKPDRPLCILACQCILILESADLTDFFIPFNKWQRRIS